MTPFLAYQTQIDYRVRVSRTHPVINVAVQTSDAIETMMTDQMEAQSHPQPMNKILEP